MKFDQDLCRKLWYELNPRVRCAFGNVSWLKDSAASNVKWLKKYRISTKFSVTWTNHGQGGAKYFQQSLPIKLYSQNPPPGQITANLWSTESKIVEHVESRIRKSWYSQHFLGRDKTLKGGNLKLRLGLDPSSKLRAFSQEKVKCSCIQTYLRQLWQAFLSFDQIFARIITCRCHIHLEYINAPNIVRPDSLTHQNCSTSKH